MSDSNKKVMTFICERAPEIDSCLRSGSDEFKDIPGLHAVKFPCSGMIQPLMVEAALKGGAEGVIVTGCQIGDCYFREGNKMIKERLLGERSPTLKKATDRRRILGLWLSRLQTDRFLSDAKEFVAFVRNLPAPEPAAKPAAAAPAAAPKAEPKAEPKKEETKAAHSTAAESEPSGEEALKKNEEAAKKREAEEKAKEKPETKKKDNEPKADKSGDGKATEDDAKSDKSNGAKEDK